MISTCRSPTLVLGNGRREGAPYGNVGVVFTFNDAACPIRCRSKVAVTPAPRSSREKFSLQLVTENGLLSDWVEEVGTWANASVEQLSHEIGCIPSTGLCLIHALWKVSGALIVDGLSLDPSLNRSPAILSSRPLPQTFHNWLGERRVTFARWIHAPRSNWRWSLFTQRPAGSVEDPCTLAPEDLLEALLAARRRRSTAQLKCIAQSPIRACPDLLRPCDVTRQLEQCFHLQRSVNRTTNWWLYDSGASHVIERLASRLRYAQLQAFQKLVQANMAAA